MNRRTQLVAAAVIALAALAACEKRSAPPAESSAAADTARADSVRRADSTMKAEESKIIGHDSAFGPIGIIDDTSGRFVEIPPRRP